MNRSLFGFVVLTAAVSLFALPARAQSVQYPDADPNYVRPRTPWGDPDIQGVFTSDASRGVGMERDAEFGDRLFLTQEEYQERAAAADQRAASLDEEFEDEDRRVGTGPPSNFNELFEEVSWQTSLVIDPPNGQVPALTPYGESRPGFGDQSNADSPEHFSYYIRCITRGVAGSIVPVIYGNGTRIVQAPGYVAISNEMVHEARIIPLDGRPHVSDDIRMYMGDSRGHWEGDTLVIETRNLTDRTGLTANGGRMRHSEDMVMTERITRIADDAVYYELTLNDPRTWVEPWTMGFPLVNENDYEIYEYACHEGNQQMRHMLSGARAEEAAAEGSR